MPEKTNIAIDLKSFHASMECVERGLDSFLGDESRTSKTICLAATFYKSTVNQLKYYIFWRKILNE